MNESLMQALPRHRPPLDPGFRPASIANRAFRKAVEESGKPQEFCINLERKAGARSQYRAKLLPDSHPRAEDNFTFVERVVKLLLWQKGGFRISVAGPKAISAFLKKAYAPGGVRAFDAEFMAGVYEHEFEVVESSLESMPPPDEKAYPRGGQLNGCRIGFDAGASDRKVAAVIDGNPVFSEEVIWNPKEEKDPRYHYREINSALKAAAAHMPRVDAIGVSAAGIYIDNRVMVASLFRGVPKDLFKRHVTNMFLDIQKEWGGIPVEVCNDGDVTALAGAMSLNDGSVLGIAMGSSEAGGYVNSDKNLTDWLNEVAFVPVDYNPGAPVDDWSGDYGCGSQYFSQVGAIRLATAAGIDMSKGATPAEKLKEIQAVLERGDDRAAKVFESIGCHLGYSLPHYADFYDIRHVLILGRVTSGKGGNILMTKTREVLRDEFPELAEKMHLHLPEEEAERRVGQAIAAASLPALGK